MFVHYYSHAGAETGYGRAARDYAAAMKSGGALIELRKLSDAPQEREKPPAGHIALYHGTPIQLAHLAEQKSSCPRVAMTTWETSQLPLHYASALNRFDAVIVPSKFCADVIDRSREIVSINDDTIKRAVVVPHCFDADLWQPTDRPKNDIFTFYSVGAWGERKNMLGVLQAYLHGFQKPDLVRLVLIINGADFDVVKGTLARSCLPQDEWPRIIVPDGVQSAEEIMRLHQEADCYVSTARGEGWGLGMFEAAVMQKPVIATGWGGQLDFLEPLGEQYLRVRHQMTPVFAGQSDVKVYGPAVMATPNMPPGADARQLWADPDLDHVSRRMWEAFEYAGERSFDLNRELLEDRYSTPVVGQELLSVLKEVLA